MLGSLECQAKEAEVLYEVREGTMTGDPHRFRACKHQVTE